MVDETDTKQLLNQLYKKKVRESSNRNIPFKLSQSYFNSLSLDNCRYCNAEPSNLFKYNGKELAYNGIDRIDSNDGYTVRNTVSACRFCNTLKGSMKADTWFSFLKAVISKHGGNIPFWYRDFSDKDRPKKSFYGKR